VEGGGQVFSEYLYFAKPLLVPQNDLFLEIVALCFGSQFRKDTIIYTFEVFAMMDAVFWDVKPSGSCKDRRFGGK
jgi:hypothetical protein